MYTANMVIGTLMRTYDIEVDPKTGCKSSEYIKAKLACKIMMRDYNTPKIRLNSSYVAFCAYLVDHAHVVMDQHIVTAPVINKDDQPKQEPVVTNVINKNKSVLHRPQIMMYHMVLQTKFFFEVLLNTIENIQSALDSYSVWGVYQRKVYFLSIDIRDQIYKMQYLGYEICKKLVRTYITADHSVPRI